MSDLFDRVVMRSLGYAVPEIVGKLTPAQLADISNGCGPGGAKVDLVPDRLLGVDFTAVCNDHDAAYPENGIEQTALRYACRKAAFDYYLAVAGWGHKAFWAGKEQPNA